MSDRNKRKPTGGDNASKKKGRYHGYTDTSSNHAIPLGSRGILVTCDSEREKRAGNELIPLVEEFYDKLEQESGSKPALPAGDAAQSTTGTTDISAMLAAEVAELKDKSKHRFKYHATGVRGTFYVVFPDDGPGPVEVTEAVLQSMRESRQLRTPHVSRLLPVTHTCYPKLEEIKTMAAAVIQGHFPTGEGVEPIDFAVEYEHRATAEIDRMQVINAFAEQVPKPHRVNLTAPSKGILVQISRNVCAAAMVSKYRHLCKFNVKTVVEVDAAEQQQKLAAKAQERENAVKKKATAAPAAAGAAGAEGPAPAAGGEDAAADAQPEAAPVAAEAAAEAQAGPAQMAA